jgi:hypothetical protein
MKGAFGFALLAALVVSAPAWAAGGRDPAAAEALFRQGRDAARSGDYKTACAKFHESDRLDPALGTKFNIADCEEKLGHLATAWTLFDDLSHRMSPSDDRLPIAERRVAELAKRVPRLTIVIDSGAPAGTTVSRDGVALGAASLNTPLPDNPGVHVIRATAPGYQAAEFSVTLKEGERRALAVHPGAKQAAPVSGEAGSAPAAPGSSHTLGYVFGGVGVAGVAVGAVTGVFVLSKKSTVNQNCDAAKRCNQTGYDAASAGRTFGIVSTTGFVVGALGLAAGAYFLLKSDGGEQEPATALVPAAGPGSAGLELVHRW